MKRDCRDDKFSHLIRLAANWTCQRCGKYYPEGSARRGLHCSHFYSRIKPITRWHPWNAASHCGGCHIYLGDNPIIFDRWIFDYLGKEKYDRLKLLSNKTTNWRNYEKDLINKHLAKELKLMLERRKDGDQSFYFFQPFEI